MAKDIVINVKNVEKSFKIYSDKGYTLKERLLFFKQRNSYTRHEVLKGVTLEIEWLWKKYIVKINDKNNLS